ncbi:hypothetical protein GCM10010435_50160 [Winogradskya consettensis]|uniref:Tyrosinase co-factor MelC1 n=1 Tax=Winogradskya consettensis TaxID=113560 RepID=A0A919VV32_9ACTN|nr:tyrosinase family oxidase copper chaperone [Actinoplanes consettensis]GIM80124.1 hypothetical protein Aco04nite_69060 [Actinoplanes consettensis]
MKGMSRRGALRMTAGAVVAASIGAGQMFSRGADARRAAPAVTRETYRGRLITIRKLAGPLPGQALPDDLVLIDDLPLHVMSNADGTFTTVTNHYRRFTTLRAASRAAVDSLGRADLMPMRTHRHK